jgi:hypothetical protein
MPYQRKPTRRSRPLKGGKGGTGKKDVDIQNISAPGSTNPTYSSDIDAANPGGPMSWSDEIRRLADGNAGMPADTTGDTCDIEAAGRGTNQRGRGA